MSRRDDFDATADWLAIRFQSDDVPSDARGLLAEVALAEQCARLLDRVGKNDGTLRPEAGTVEQTVIPLLDVGRFEIVRFVGRGGMGNVFLAVDPVLQRKVAIKIPRLDLRGDPKLQQRFLREARVMAGLAHRNLIPILEIGQDGPSVFLVLAWCDGPDLGEWLARQEEPPAATWAAQLVAVLAETLEHCHAQGVVHRDLKPSNILLDKLGDEDNEHHEPFPFVPKISDFGLARVLEEGLEQTDSSLLLGTPQYMAPEQAECRHQDVGPHTDVYALGVILYQLLTRSLPFEGTTAVRLLDQIRHDNPPSLTQSRDDVARSLQIICEKCLQKRTEDRYQTMGELAADLRRFCRGEPIAARPLSVLTKLDRWSRRPARLYDAALVTIAINLIFVVWMVALTFEDVGGHGLPLYGPVARAIGRVAVIAIFVHCVPIGLAVFILRKQRWAMLAATVMAAILWLWITSILFGLTSPFPGYEERPMLKLRVFWMLEILSLTQLVALLLALRAREK